MGRFSCAVDITSAGVTLLHMALQENPSEKKYTLDQPDPYALDHRLMQHVRLSLAAVTQHNRFVHPFHDAEQADSEAEQRKIAEWDAGSL